MSYNQLGKISYINFGFGGYDGAMFGLDLVFEGDGWGVGDFKGWWADPPSKEAKWTVADQQRLFLEAMELLKQTLKAAKKTRIQDLVGIPVEVTIEGGKIQSWRVLKEVL